MKMKKRWTLLFSVLLGIFSCVGVSRASAQQEEVLNGAVGESIKFPTRVPTSGTIIYEGRNIGQVLNKQSDTDSEEKFKNRLHWNSEFFILSDLRSDDSGVYTVESTREERAKHTYQLNVYDKVSKPQVTTLNHYSSESDLCSLQCSVRNVRGLNLSWFRGNVLLNHTSSSSPDTTLSLPLEIQQIDKDLFSCEASNPVSKQNTTVNSTVICLQESERTTNSKRSYIILVILSCVVFLVAVIGMIIFIRRKKHETSRRSEDSSATEGRQEEVQYSEINHFSKKRIQGNVCESASQESSLLTTVYDRIRPHQTETSVQSDSA